jgi:hypothetical protein
MRKKEVEEELTQSKQHFLKKAKTVQKMNDIDQIFRLNVPNSMWEKKEKLREKELIASYSKVHSEV